MRINEPLLLLSARRRPRGLHIHNGDLGTAMKPFYSRLVRSTLCGCDWGSTVSVWSLCTNDSLNTLLLLLMECIICGHCGHHGVTWVVITRSLGYRYS